MGTVIAREVALADIERWLNYKRVNDRKREEYKDNIDTLVDAVCDGDLVVAEDCTLVHTLRFPIETGESKTTTLEYKPRLKMSTVHAHLQGVKATDGDGRLAAYIAALTSKPKAVVLALETDDYSISQSIAFFFI